MDGLRVKLLYISPGFTAHDWRFLTAFRVADWDISHLRLTANLIERRPVPTGVRVLHWSTATGLPQCPLDCFRHWRAMKQMLVRSQPDVVLVGPVPTAAFLVALTGYRRYVAMSWGSDVLIEAFRDKASIEATRYALDRAKGIFGDCNAVAETVGSLVRPRPGALLTFPWGVDLERFHPGPSALTLGKQLGWENNRVLICTRSWEPVYGIDTLLRAFAEVASAYPDARLLLIGDGSLREQIATMLRDPRLTGRVHAPGRINNDALPDYFRMADLYVSAAMSDGSSVSLLEAMACGLPVVVTAGYVNLEWVVPGQNGWLVKAGDAGELAEALGSALSLGAHDLSRMRAANVAVTRERANWAENVPRLRALLQQVAKR